MPKYDEWGELQMLKRNLRALSSLLLVFALFVGGFQTQALAAEQDETITVIGNAEVGTLLDLTVVKDAENQTAFDVLVKAVGEDSIEYTDGQYGKMINGIKGLTAEGNFYWAFYINGVSAQVGADSYVVQDDDQLTFQYIDWTVPVENTTSITVVGKDGKTVKEATAIAFINNPTAFQLLQVVLGHDKIKYSEEQYGKMISAIDGLAAEGTYYWAFYVNGEMASVGADSYELKASDEITFKYESWEAPTEETNDEIIVETPAIPFDQKTLGTAVDTASQYVLANQIGEWEAIALNKAGKSVPPSYLTTVQKLVKEKEGKFSRITDTERYVLGILAAGGNPTNVEGYNLVEAIYNGDVTKQGLNGVAYGLLALDSADFEIPENATWTREKLVSHLLEKQNEDGGWSWDGSATSDIDTTGMVLTALAAHQNQTEVQISIDLAVEYLSAQFQAGKIDNSSTAAQVIIALSALGIDANGELFASDAGSLIGYLLTFQNADGGFDWQGGDVSDVFTTAQGFQALVAYQLFVKGEGSLYTLPLVSDITPVVEKEETKTTTTEEGKLLPNTSTNMYNYLTVGIILLMIGAVFFVSERRKKA